MKIDNFHFFCSHPSHINTADSENDIYFVPNIILSSIHQNTVGGTEATGSETTKATLKRYAQCERGQSGAPMAVGTSKEATTFRSAAVDGGIHRILRSSGEI